MSHNTLGPVGTPVSAKVHEGELVRVHERLRVVWKEADLLSQSLHRTADRVFGPIPVDPSSDIGMAPDLPSIVEVNAIIDMAMGCLIRARHGADRLDAL